MRWSEPWLLVFLGLGIVVVGALSQSAFTIVAGFVVVDLSLGDAVWRLWETGQLAVVAPRPSRAVGITSAVLLIVGVSLVGAILFVRDAVADAPQDAVVIVVALFAAPPLAGLLGGSAFWSRRATHPRHMFRLGALMVVVFLFALLGTAGMAMTVGFGRAGMTAQRVAIEYSAIWFSGVGSMALLGVAAATITAASRALSNKRINLTHAR